MSGAAVRRRAPRIPVAAVRLPVASRTAGPPDPRFADVGRLVVRCPDRPGIVAVLSGLMAEVGANIIDSQQHSSDPSGGTFTLRLEFLLAGLAAPPRRAGAAAGRAGGGSGGWSGG